MSDIDRHWHRWIFASTAKAFREKLLLGSQNVLVEGQKRNTTGWNNWYEIRIDGPYYWPITKNQTKCHVEVNVLCALVPEGDNAYALQDLIGYAQAAFVNDVCVFKYGPSSDPENDGTFFSTLTLNPGNNREKIVTSIFGQANPTTNLRQATVEGHYRLFIDL